MAVKRRGILFCLVGPAGSGKSTVGQRIIAEKRIQLARSISVTTRAPREGEVDGSDYFFVSVSDFNGRIGRGEFFEWEENHGNLYGTLKRYVTDSVDSGKDLLLIIDIKGALTVKKALPQDCVVIFLLPPSFDSLVYRMKGRGTIGAEELAMRLETARSEYKALLDSMQSGEGIDHLVVNDQLEETQRAIEAIVEGERHKISRVVKESVKGLCSV